MIDYAAELRGVEWTPLAVPPPRTTAMPLYTAPLAFAREDDLDANTDAPREADGGAATVYTHLAPPRELLAPATDVDCRPTV